MRWSRGIFVFFLVLRMVAGCAFGQQPLVVVEFSIDLWMSVMCVDISNESAAVAYDKAQSKAEIYRFTYVLVTAIYI